SGAWSDASRFRRNAATSWPDPSEPGLDAPILMTERLAFRPFRPEDFGDFTALHTDPEVQRFIGGVWDEPALREFFDKFLREQPQVGFTKWRMDERDDTGGGGFVGSAGLSLNADTGAADLRSEEHT